MKRLKLFFLSIALFAAGGLFAQQDLILYNMEVVPQRIYTNPALIPSNKVNIGLPLISSEYLSIDNSGFKYSDLIQHRADDSLYIDYDNMLGKLGKYNYVQLALRPDLLSFGFKSKNKKNYFSFNATEKVDFRFSYPKKFMEFIWKGNGAFLNEQVDLNFGLNFTHYREYGFGFARQINDKLSLGGKLKYLNGFSNIWTEKTDASLTTESTYFAITAKADMLVHISGMDTATLSNLKPEDLMKGKNPGGGIDLGGSYKYNDKLSFSASVIDLGFIKWKDHVLNYESKGTGSFTYKGIDAAQLIKDRKKTITDLISDLRDSVTNAIGVDSTYKSYTTWLNTKIYLGGNYYFSEKSNAGLLAYSQFFDKRIHPGVALSFNQKVGRWLCASVSYAIYNRSYENIGLGLSLNAGSLQLYVANDNIIGTILPQNAKNIHVHFGINLTFGRPPKDRDKDGIADKKDACPDVPGLKEFNGCPDKDGDHIPDAKDDCPDVAGLAKFNGCPDKDGDGVIDKKDSCPDIAGRMELNGCPDKDGDKIIDKLDSCPDEAGLAAFHGCPDVDHDGVVDKLDACPNDSGAIATNGCPDRDNDGVLDKNDRCPDKAGLKENDGCPLAKLQLLDKQRNVVATAIIGKDGKFTYTNLLPDDNSLMKLESYDVLPVNEVIVVSGNNTRISRRGIDGLFHFDAKNSKAETPDIQIKLNKEEAQVVKHAMETLEFDSGSDIIRPSSTDGLNLVAKLLVQNKEWRLKLSGHTDNKSSLKFNMRLSKKRVESIKKYLVKKGVTPSHIVLKWFGPTKPIATNSTAEGRQKNRRVEFLIIR